MSNLNARVKGHSYERAIVDLLRKMGYNATTSRYSNRMLDDAKVDLDTDFPFNIQAKAVERLTMSPHQLLSDMPTDKPPVIFHKRNNKGTVVIMKMDDFFRLALTSSGPINP